MGARHHLGGLLRRRGRARHADPRRTSAAQGYADKAVWRKETGDKLEANADPLADERKAFWERLGMMPSAHEIAELDALYDWLTSTDNDGERRALLALARSKVGGKSLRRWCFKVEGIHPETSRRRKDRALTKIQANLSGRTMQHDENLEIRVLHAGAEISDVSDTFAEDMGKRDGLKHWAAVDALQPFTIHREVYENGLLAVQSIPTTGRVLLGSQEKRATAPKRSR